MTCLMKGRSAHSGVQEGALHQVTRPRKKKKDYSKPALGRTIIYYFLKRDPRFVGNCILFKKNSSSNSKLPSQFDGEKLNTPFFGSKRAGVIKWCKRKKCLLFSRASPNFAPLFCTTTYPRNEKDGEY